MALAKPSLVAQPHPQTHGGDPTPTPTPNPSPLPLPLPRTLTLTLTLTLPLPLPLSLTLTLALPGEVGAEGGSLTVGRVKLPIAPHAAPAPFEGGSFALTRHALALMERVAACVRVDEPVLLVGETGTGKTTVVQQLAQQMGHTLVVHNLNQQSDSSELLGGFRP